MKFTTSNFIFVSNWFDILGVRIYFSSILYVQLPCPPPPHNTTPPIREKVYLDILDKNP